MQELSPAPIAMLRKVVFTSSRAGRPKEMLDRPMVVARPCAAHQRIVSRPSRAASALEATASASTSTSTRRRGMPSMAALSSMFSMMAMRSAAFTGSLRP